MLAQQFAAASPMVQASLVEATQFIELSYKYQVSSVPHTTINDGAGTLIGAAPEEYLINEIKQALDSPKGE